MGAVYSCADGGAKSVIRNIFMPHTLLERLKKKETLSASDVYQQGSNEKKPINPIVIGGVLLGIAVVGIVIYRVTKN